MLLTIDIGNTNITMGVFEEEMLLGMFRMTTKRQRTSDEYGFMRKRFYSKLLNIHSSVVSLNCFFISLPLYMIRTI